MQKKIGFFCLFVTLLFVCLAFAPSDCISAKSQTSTTSGPETLDHNTQKPMGMTGYLLVHVSVYTPGKGIRPYAGANVTMKGLFFSYQGTTDEQGDCLLQVHTHLLRGKRYIVKVSIPPANLLHTKINSLVIEPTEIVYKDFLFIVLKDG